jgi:hypothetical protein
MKNNTIRTLSIRMAATAILLLAPASMRAASISLEPSSTVVSVGNVFTIDVMANNLGLGAYDVTFSYSPLIVFVDTAQVTFDSHLGAPDNSFQFVDQTLDTIEVAEVSFFTRSADLAALQTGVSFPLAHIQVKALQPGTAPFNFVSTPYTAVSDYSGTAIDGLAYQATSVLIQEPVASTDTPEPAAPILIVSALCVLTSGRFRREAIRLTRIFVAQVLTRRGRQTVPCGPAAMWDRTNP